MLEPSRPLPPCRAPLAHPARTPATPNRTGPLELGRCRGSGRLLLRTTPSTSPPSPPTLSHHPVADLAAGTASRRLGWQCGCFGGCASVLAVGVTVQAATSLFRAAARRIERRRDSRPLPTACDPRFLPEAQYPPPPHRRPFSVLS